MRSVRNILVTGGAGFIGSAFIRYALPLADKIVNLDLLTYAGNLDSLKSVENDPRYHFVQGNICNPLLIERLCQEHEIDTIIHFAAESHVDRSILGPKAFLETNVFGTFQLLEVLRNRPYIHFHHVSTDEVYGSIEVGAFTEESPLKPNSPYSASKAASDCFVRAYAQTYNLSTTISHCTNNYGPWQHAEKFIPLMIQCCLEQKPLPLYGDGLNVRDWLYVEDHAEALWLILQKGTKGETYNIGGGWEMRNIDLAHLIVELLETDPSLITFVKDRPGHDFRYAIDYTKIKTAIGWAPRHSLKDGLQKTIAWHASSIPTPAPAV